MKLSIMLLLAMSLLAIGLAGCGEDNTAPGTIDTGDRVAGAASGPSGPTGIDDSQSRDGDKGIPQPAPSQPGTTQSGTVRPEASPSGTNPGTQPSSAPSAASQTSDVQPGTATAGNGQSGQGGASGQGAMAPQSGVSSMSDQASEESEKLLGHRFVLQSVNGSAFSGKGEKPELEFGEGLRMVGGICNRFTGQAVLKNGVLSAPALAMTRMACADQERNALERTFARMMERGAALTFDDKTLRLEQGGDTLVYELADRVR